MKLFYAAGWLFALALVCTAQSPSKILSNANKALGGEKALKAVTSTRMSGRITRMSDNASGTFAARSAAGGLYSSLYDLNGFEFSSGHNGKSGWVRDSRDGLRTLTGDAGRDFQAEASYRAHRWLKAKDERAKLTLAGTAAVDGRPANGVTLTTAKGARIRILFDAATGMPVREEFAGRTLEYRNYKAVAGIKTPFDIRLIEGGETYEIALDEVGYNQQIARSVFDFPQVSAEALPDIPTLLNEVRANADKVEDILDNYSFTQERIERELKDNGQMVVKESEKRLLSFYKGYRIARTIEKNGKPLSASDQAKEDKDVEKQVVEIEKKIADKAKQERKIESGSVGQPKEDGRRFTIAEALKGSRLVNPRRERFRGRDVVVFDYEPDPAFKPKTRNEKLFALCTGAVWVDPALAQVVRLEAKLTQGIGNFVAKASRGASFTLENELVNNEIWLPSQADINLSIKLFLIAGININNVVRSGDYRRFATEVKDATVGDEKRP